MTPDEKKCPYIGLRAVVIWDAIDQSFNRKNGIVTKGHFSSIVGWAITIKFEDGMTRSYPLRDLAIYNDYPEI
jgi:hypothetical protein